MVDGDESQQSAILFQGLTRKRAITLVLDLIHVIHYLWLAGFALCRKDKKATDLWMTKHLLLLLSSPVDELIAAIEEAARRLGLAQRKPVDQALRYFRRNKSFMEGHARVRRVETTINMRWPEARGVQFILDGTAGDVGVRLSADRSAAGLDPSRTSVCDPIFVNLPSGERVQLVELLNEHLNDKPDSTPGLHEKKISVTGATIEVEERGGIPLSSIVLTYEMVSAEPRVVSTATRVAALVAAGFGDENYVIFEDDLRRFTIGADGEVVPASAPPSRR